MADTKLSQLSARPEDAGDPWLDRFYAFLNDGSGDANKQVAMSPFDMQLMVRRKYTWDWNDFHDPYSVAGATSGAGAETRGYVWKPDLNDWGVLRVQTGTTSTGYAVYLWADTSTTIIRMLNKKVRTIGWVMTHGTNISDGTNRFAIVHGFCDDISTISPNNCIYVRYIDNVNSGKWQLVCRSGGTESVQDIGVTVAVDTKYRIEIEIDGDAPSVRARIDGGAWTTAITTNIPTNATMYIIPVGIIKTLGTTTREAFCDAMGWMVEFANAR